MPCPDRLALPSLTVSINVPVLRFPPLSRPPRFPVTHSLYDTRASLFVFQMSRSSLQGRGIPLPRRMGDYRLASKGFERKAAWGRRAPARPARFGLAAVKIFIDRCWKGVYFIISVTNSSVHERVLRIGWAFRIRNRDRHACVLYRGEAEEGHGHIRDDARGMCPRRDGNGAHGDALHPNGDASSRGLRPFRAAASGHDLPAPQPRSLPLQRGGSLGRNSAHRVRHR